MERTSHTLHVHEGEEAALKSEGIALKRALETADDASKNELRKKVKSVHEKWKLKSQCVATYQGTLRSQLATMNKINAELAGPQQQETGGDESDEDFSFGE